MQFGFVVWMRLAVVALTWAGALAPVAATAQDTWVQIEAQPSLAEAEARARAYAGVFPNVNGFILPSGWYAIALGPFSPNEAERQLPLLVGERMIPADSYLSDGGRFQRRFWPVGAPPLAAAEPALPALTEPAPDPLADPATADLVLIPAEPPEETLREARFSEAALGAEERELLQTALAWFGHYTSAIDGAFGPGTRASMAEWQAAMGLDPTGVLTSRQRAMLLEGYRSEQAALGLAPYRDERAGIALVMPAALVQFDRYEPPFAHFAEKDGSGVRMLLISQQGDEGTLFGLYDIMQTLEIVPLDGPRERSATSFTISGQNARFASFTQARLEGGFVKGFTLVWRPEDSARVVKVLDAMKTSFTSTGDAGLGDVAEAGGEALAPGLLAGLEVRRPLRSRSGFFVDAGGLVLTTTEVLEGCSRLTLDTGTNATALFIDPALGIALLKPEARLAPAAHAAFRTAPPRANSEIAVAGFPYEDALPSPVMTFGSFAAAQGLEGEQTLVRLALASLPGDAGGPVFDTSGAVLGMLLPRQTGGARVLPHDTGFAVDAEAIAAALAANGAEPSQAEANGALAAEDLSRLALRMTVLVSCWE